MKMRPTFIAVMAGAALLVSGCSASAPESAPSDGSATDEERFADLEPMELVFNQTEPPGSHFADADTAFTEYITEATGGKVTFETHYSAALLPASETFGGVGAGVADVSYATPLPFAEQFPIAHWLSPAMSADKAPYPLGDLVNYAAVNDFIANEPIMQAEYEAQNVKPLWYISSSPGDMLCTDPIDSLEDAAGRMTRSGSAPLTNELDALGMTSISMPFVDLYEGLQRETIDCVYTTAGNTTFRPYSLTEVAKYYLALEGWTPVTALGYIVNLDRWNSFSPELQEVFHEAAIEAMATHTEGAFGTIAEFGATAEEDGVEFVDTTELRQVLSALHEDLIAELPTTAPASVDDPEQLIQSLTEYRAKWRDLIATQVLTEAPDESMTALDGDALRDAFAASNDLIDWDAFHSLIKEQAGITD